MKPSKVKIALKCLLLARRPGFLWGSPGIGKSDVVRQVAEELGFKLIDVRVILLDPVDLRGLPTIDPDKYVTKWCPPVFLPKGKGKYLLFLDELNAAPPAMQAACYQLVLDRKIGEYTLPKNCVIVAAGNRETDRAVTSRMPSPLANRFGLHINFEVNVDDWIEWALGKDIISEIIAFIRFRPNLLNAFDPQRNDKAFPTPRSWEFASDLMKAFNSEGSSIEHEMLSGVVGEGAATEFMGFLKVFRSIPDPDMILMYPKKAEVPTDPAVLYAVCGVLVKKADPKTIKNIVTYANRLPDEFSVFLMLDCIRKDETLTETRGFIEWASVHASVFNIGSK